LSASQGHMSGPAANLMVPGIHTLRVMEMLERPRMGVILVQDHLGDLGTERQRREVEGEEEVLQKVTMFPKRVAESKVVGQTKEAAVQRERVEEAEMEGKKETEEARKEMVEVKRRMVEIKMQIVEEKGNLGVDKAVQMEAANQRKEDVLMLSSRPVLMSVLALILRSLVLAWLDVPKDVKITASLQLIYLIDQIQMVIHGMF